MPQIGRLKPSAPDSLSQFRGELHTLDHRHVIRLEGDDSLCDSRTPSHRIYARSKAGASMKLRKARGDLADAAVPTGTSRPLSRNSWTLFF
jgi:hypothetical protein